LKSESGIYVWDANEMTHLDMVKALRALGYEDAENYFPKKGYTSKSVGDKVTVEDMNGHWMDISIDELLSSKLVMAKQAALPPQQPINENTNASTAIMMEDGSVYFSDEPFMVHVKLIKQLGLPAEHIVSGGYIKDGVYYDRGAQTDTMRYVEIEKAKKDVKETIKRYKQAGSYSSTYTDEQGEQFFNEQHYNNDDEEPYVDHSERDYDGGYWDAATNTGQNTPWAKDITPSVCLLDQLQNPADRNYPPGMPDYSTVFYEALPASDGIEATNPD
jgi:hypothetical protein